MYCIEVYYLYRFYVYNNIGFYCVSLKLYALLGLVLFLTGFESLAPVVHDGIIFISCEIIQWRVLPCYEPWHR